MRFAKTCRSAERGSASLEFITLGVLLLVPLIYLVLFVSSAQAGSLAAEGAARQAARLWVQAESVTRADQLGARTAQLAAADFGFGSSNVTWRRECIGRCLAPGSRVTVTVEITVPLPLLPPGLFGPHSTSVRMQSSATQTVSLFGGGG